MTAVAIIAAIFSCALFFGWDKRNHHMDIVRAQFHLSSQIKFSEFKDGSSKLKWPLLEGTVRFSVSEYHDYVSAMDDAEVWKPTLLRYRGVSRVDQYSREALRWRSQRPPLRYGSDGLADWGIFSDEAMREITNGRYFCYAIMRNTTASTGVDAETRARSCWQLDPRDEPVAVVEGVLDVDRRTLHMRI